MTEDEERPPEDQAASEESDEGLGDIDADLAVLMPRPDETDTGLKISKGGRKPAPADTAEPAPPPAEATPPKRVVPKPHPVAKPSRPKPPPLPQAPLHPEPPPQAAPGPADPESPSIPPEPAPQAPPPPPAHPARPSVPAEPPPAPPAQSAMPSIPPEPPPQAPPPPAQSARPSLPPEPAPEEQFDFDLQQDDVADEDDERHQVQKESFGEALSADGEEDKVRKFGGPKRRKVATVKKARAKARPGPQKGERPGAEPTPRAPAASSEPIKEAFPGPLPENLAGDLSEAATQRIPGHQRYSDLPAGAASAEEDQEVQDFFDIGKKPEEVQPPRESEPPPSELAGPPVVSTVEQAPDLKPDTPLSPPNLQIDSGLSEKDEASEAAPAEAGLDDLMSTGEPGLESGPAAEEELDVDQFPVAEGSDIPAIADEFPPEKAISAASTEEIPIAEPTAGSDPDSILDQEFREFMGGDGESSSGDPPPPMTPSADPSESVREYKKAESRDLDTPYTKEELENLFSEEARPTPPWEKPKSRRRTAQTSRRARAPRRSSSGKILFLLILFGVVIGIAHFEPSVQGWVLPRVVTAIEVMKLEKYFPAYVSAVAPEASPKGVEKPPEGADKPPEEVVKPPEGAEKPPPEATEATGSSALDAFIKEALRSERLGLPSPEATAEEGEV